MNFKMAIVAFNEPDPAARCRAVFPWLSLSDSFAPALRNKYSTKLFWFSRDDTINGVRPSWLRESTRLASSRNTSFIRERLPLAAKSWTFGNSENDEKQNWWSVWAKWKVNYLSVWSGIMLINHWSLTSHFGWFQSLEVRFSHLNSFKTKRIKRERSFLINTKLCTEVKWSSVSLHWYWKTTNQKYLAVEVGGSLHNHVWRGCTLQASHQ